MVYSRKALPPIDVTVASNTSTAGGAAGGAQTSRGPEEMARAQDIEVVNLLAVGIFEPWIADPETLARAWKYMGESTKKIASDTAHRLSCGDNLPRC